MPQKRRAKDKTVAPAQTPGKPSLPAPQRKKGKIKQPVAPSSDSAESDSKSEDPGSDYDDTVDVSDDSGDEGDDDDCNTEEVEEAERAKLLLTLEGQDTLTVDQAIVLEPRETHTYEDDHAPEPVLEDVQSTSLAILSMLCRAYLFCNSCRARKTIDQ